MKVTRRDFFKGAAFTGAAAAAAAVGMSVPVTALADEAAKAEEPANSYLGIYGGDTQYLPVRAIGEKPTFRNGVVAFEDRVIGDDEIQRVDSCDFLVIGAGICGIVGALKASSEGAKVICVEKTSRGRSTWESMGGYGSKAQEASDNEVDPARFADAILRGSCFRALPEVVWSYINNSGEAIDFVQDVLDESEYDIEIYNTTQPETGYDLVTIQAEHKFKITGPVEWKAHMTGMFPMAALTSVAESRDNIDLRLYTAGVQLIQDASGKVTGAIVKDESGYYRIDAVKGVLLATGGYHNNLDMMKAWLRPEDYAVPYQEDAAIGDTGDGHMMGLKVGANMDPVPHCAMIFSGGYPDEASRRCPAKQMVRAVAPLVDGRGRRFCNEAHQKECVANALNTAHTFNGGAWFIFDQDVMDTMKEPMDKYFANGTLAKGETLDDLAKALGIPAERLKETIDTWNGYFDAETPTDLAFRRDLVSVNPVVKAFTEGKVQASALPVKRGPFYSMTCSATFLTTVSGLIIDEKCRVLDTSGDVIEGLYAGGNASGGMYSDVYPRHLPSTSVGRAATFGYVAARHATKGE